MTFFFECNDFISIYFIYVYIFKIFSIFLILWQLDLLEELSAFYLCCHLLVEDYTVISLLGGNSQLFFSLFFLTSEEEPVTNSYVQESPHEEPTQVGVFSTLFSISPEESVQLIKVFFKISSFCSFAFWAFASLLCCF